MWVVGFELRARLEDCEKDTLYQVSDECPFSAEKMHPGGIKLWGVLRLEMIKVLIESAAVLGAHGGDACGREVGTGGWQARGGIWSWLSVSQRDRHDRRHLPLCRIRSPRNPCCVMYNLDTGLRGRILRRGIQCRKLAVPDDVRSRRRIDRPAHREKSGSDDAGDGSPRERIGAAEFVGGESGDLEIWFRILIRVRRVIGRDIPLRPRTKCHF